MPLLPYKTDEEHALETRARMVCREWAQVRVGLLPFIEIRSDLAEFDRAMFALGEVVYGTAAGEVAEAHPSA